MSTRMEREYTREDREWECLEQKINREKNKKGDAVERPSHYMFFDMEAINIIQASLTHEEFKGYLKGNALKYRLRCGKKDDAMQDLKKAEQYEKMYRGKKC